MSPSNTGWRGGGVGLLAQVMKDGAERDRQREREREREREIVSVQKCQSSGSSRDRSGRAKMVEPVYPKRGKDPNDANFCGILRIDSVR